PVAVVDVMAPVTLPPVLNLKLPAPRSVRVPMFVHVPVRFVTVPVFAPFTFQVAPVAFSVPVVVSERFSIALHEIVALLPASEAVIVYVCAVPLTVSVVPVPPTTVLMPL